ELLGGPGRRSGSATRIISVGQGGREHLHRVGSLKGCRIGAVSLAQASLDLLDRAIPLCLEPGAEPVQQGAEVGGPGCSRAEAVMMTSAPTKSSLSASSDVWTPVDAAREIESWGRRMAIQRSGKRSSALVLSVRRGLTWRVSSARSGSRKRL